MAIMTLQRRLLREQQGRRKTGSIRKQSEITKSASLALLRTFLKTHLKKYIFFKNVRNSELCESRMCESRGPPVYSSPAWFGPYRDF